MSAINKLIVIKGPWYSVCFALLLIVLSWIAIKYLTIYSSDANSGNWKVISPHWTVRNYNSPHIKHLGASDVLIVENPPAGIYIRRYLKSNTKYELKINGSGVAQMRLNIGNESSAYSSAPSNFNFRQTIHGANMVELRLYSTTPTAYEILDLDLRECDQCKTETDYYH